MDNKINGRTPEEIKKGLRQCGENTWCDGPDCPYYEIPECHTYIAKDALALIQQLEYELSEIREYYDCSDAANTELHSALYAMKRERDAAVERLARYKKCIDCRRYPEIKKNLFCDDCVQGDKWQWCGEPLEVK